MASELCASALHLCLNRRGDNQEFLKGEGSRYRKTCRLLILLLAVFIQHENFHLIFALGPTVGGRRESVSCCAAAGQIQCFLESWDRPGVLPWDIFEGQT